MFRIFLWKWNIKHVRILNTVVCLFLKSLCPAWWPMKVWRTPRHFSTIMDIIQQFPTLFYYSTFLTTFQHFPTLFNTQSTFYDSRIPWSKKCSQFSFWIFSCTITNLFREMILLQPALFFSIHLSFREFFWSLTTALVLLSLLLRLHSAFPLNL